MFSVARSLVRPNRSTVSFSKSNCNSNSMKSFMSTTKKEGTASDLVTMQVNSGVCTIKLNQPETLNALTVDMGVSFVDVVEKIKKGVEKEEIRSVVLTGSGKAFSAGGDLKFLLERSNDTFENNYKLMRDFYNRFLAIRKVNVPVISAINGHAVGAGLCIALATDIRLASKSAKMGVTFTGLGIHAGMAGTHFLPSLVGNQNAAYLLLSGELVSADEAERLGLVLKAYEDDKLMEETMKLANNLASKSGVAVRSTLLTLRKRQEKDLEESLHREAEAQAECYAHPDIKEGIAAIKEKRKPNFASKL
eukprot:TRINITY_DN1783_c0_g1_i1.p1 TRINITY_DN1783_c0_g1~~TRINITY_DN1783_c0_g1_i1.p1  ORF type:complete len:306 (+),score=123.13 TRINITY_DN1783_c0_g1_i1:55-972(+)